jgi:hypothetical protein
MPREEPLGCKRLVIVPCGVKHHFNDAINSSIRRFESPDIYAEAAGNRGTDLIRVKPLPFDLATLEHIDRKGLKHRFFTQFEAECFDVPDQATLPVADGGERLGERLAV